MAAGGVTSVRDSGSLCGVSRRSFRRLVRRRQVKRKSGKTRAGMRGKSPLTLGVSSLASVNEGLVQADCEIAPATIKGIDMHKMLV
jgi:hypothetical protein